MSKVIEVESCIDCRFSGTDDYNYKICNLGIELGLFYLKEPPDNCPLREGAITVALAGSEDKNPKKWTDQDMLDLIEGLMDYTHESHTVLGHDGRDAEYYFNLFVERKNNEQ